MCPVSTYHHGDLPAALLRAAGRTLEKQGIGALSLRATARRAGVSHNAPYRHFPDREALLAALAAAAAWSLVHGLAHLLLDGHFAAQDPETFVREVLGAVRFAQRAA